MDENYYTTQGAAKLLGISVRTVQLWLDKGLLEGWKTEGGHRRITRQSVLRALESQGPGGLDEPPAILVIEDDPAYRKLYRYELERWPCPPVVYTARNGYEGLVMLGESRPDLLICDLRMPGLDGFQIIRALDVMDSVARLSIIAVTALSPQEIKAHGGLPPRVQILPKPLDFKKLREIVDNLRRPVTA